MVGSLFTKELIVAARPLAADPAVSSIFPEEPAVDAVPLIFLEEHIGDAMRFSESARAAP